MVCNRKSVTLVGILKSAVRGVPAKDVGPVRGAEVRILFPTPNKNDRFLYLSFLFLVVGKSCFEPTFVALPQMRYASVPKVVVSLLA